MPYREKIWNIDVTSVSIDQKLDFLYYRLGLSSNFLVNSHVILTTFIAVWILYFLSALILQKVNRNFRENQKILIIFYHFNKFMRFILPYIHECLLFQVSLYIGLAFKHANCETFFNFFSDFFCLLTFLYFFGVFY